MTQFRFYSTGLNSNNILFNIFEFNFDNYSNIFTIDNDFVPLAETFFVPDKDDINNYFNVGYNIDYCRVVTPSNTYYLFVDRIEPSITNNGWTVYFTIDIWNTYNLIALISQNKLTVRAKLEQGHVNDYVRDSSDSSVAHPTLIYTNDMLEAPLMKDGLTFERSTEAWYEPSAIGIKYGYLYCLVNAGADGVSVLNPRQYFVDWHRAGEKFDSNVGNAKANLYRTVVFGICLNDGTLCEVYNGTTISTINNGKRIQDINVIAGQSGNTNFGVVSMYLSPIPPTDGTKFTVINNKVYLSTTSQSYTDTNGKYFGTNIEGVIPTQLEQSITLQVSSDLVYATDNININNIGNNSTLTYEQYFNDYIVKSRSNIYNKTFLFIDNNKVELETFETYDREIFIQLDPTLTYMSLDTTQIFKKGYASKRYLEVYSSFEPIYNNSYWQRRTAEMSTLSAQFAVVNSAIDTAGGVASSLTRGAGAYTSGKYEDIPGIAVSGVTGLVKGVSSIVQNSYNLAYVDEVNKAIINSGVANNTQTNLGSLYMSNSGISLVQIRLTDYCKQQVNTYLHTYGYSSDILITEKFFTEHRRKTFNYIKCSNAVVSGASEIVCRYVEKLLLSGVTLWHTLDNNHINYEKNNIQVNI